ncbi:MAG: MFS transporter [Candidatus Nanopelagicales bacterium]
MLNKYRLAFADPRARAFSFAGFIARMPISMVGIGILMYVESARGNYTLAGAVSATGAIASAVGGPITSRLTDRFGQHRVLPWQIFIVVTAAAALIFTIPSNLPAIFIFIFATISGFFAPSIGALVRARWTALLVSGPVLITAFSVESMIDEIIFVIGPTVAAFTSVNIHPAAPQVIAVVFLLIGGSWLISMRDTEPPINQQQIKHGKPVVFRNGLLWLVFIHFLAGIFFGSIETTMIAFSDFAGVPIAAGFLLALWSIGSLIGGIFYGASDFKLPLPKQLILISLVLIPPAVIVPFVDSLAVLAVMSVMAGFGIAPLLISAASIAQQRAGDGRTTEAIASMYSGIGVGFAFAASSAGWLIDNHGTSWAFTVGTGAAFAITLGTVLAQGRLSRPIQP